MQGQTRQHARLLNLLGVRQLAVGVNKMDSDTAGYKEARYDEIKNEMQHMLTKVGWKKEFVESSVPFLPISGWMATTSSRSPRTWRGGRVETSSPSPARLRKWTPSWTTSTRCSPCMRLQRCCVSMHAERVI